MTLAPADQFVVFEEILPLLGPTKRMGDWYMAFCPSHSDGQKHGGRAGQSLALSTTGVLKCFAGCDFKSIMAALRASSWTPAPTPIRDTAEKLVKVYQYKDAEGVVLAEKGRFETANGQKTFRWRLPNTEGWKGGVDLKTIPLYGAWLLKERPDEPVYFVEGEKACEACWDQGLLAVTHAGGAGVKDFGTALDVLKRRTVYLWPDNDAPGRQHMNMVQARLEGVAATVRFVVVSVPEKGDAYDYFLRGGSVDELDTANPNDPVVTILAEDAVRVTVPTLMGAVTLTFSELEKTARSLDAEVTVTCFGSSQRPYSQRLNLLSSSARTELRRDLESLFGGKETKDAYNWPLVLNTALALTRETYLEQDRGMDVFEIPDPVGDVMVMQPFIPDGPMVLFGDGSSGKSYFCFKLALHIGLGGTSFCGFPVPYMPVMVIDYEDSASNFRRRMKRLGAGIADGVEPGNVYYWPANGIPLKDQVEAIKRKCEKHGIGLLIIDSAAPACGGPPEDSEAALAYFRALKKIGLPSITIAHVNKSGDTTKPFGSVFWHNEARRTWWVRRVQEEDADEIDIGVYCRKVNDGPKPAPIGFHVSFDGKDGPVRMRQQPLDQVQELLDETSPRNRIWAALDNVSLTIADIAKVTGLDSTTIEGQLYKKNAPFHVTGESATGGKGRPAKTWGRKDFSGTSEK